MPFVTDQLTLLGLNEREVKVFTSLAAFGPLSMTALAGRSGVPRTTVDYIVRSLIKQGIISTKKVGARTLYAVSLEELAERLDSLEGKLRSRPGASVSGEKAGTSQTYSFAQVVADHGGERMSVLLGEYTHPNGRTQALAGTLQALSAANVKAHIVLGRDTAGLLCAHRGEVLPCLPEWLWTASIVPPAFCLVGTDLFAFRDVAILQGRESTAVVEASEAVEAYKVLVRNTSELGRQVDLRAYVKGECSG